MPEEEKCLSLPDVWRTCNKLRAAIFRVGLNLWDYYKPLDPSNQSLISESKFISVLTGPLKGIVGLTDKEICELAHYFRIQDGRIPYKQFCQVIHDSVPDFCDNKPLVTGLEWEDPLHVNRVSAIEYRKLNLILTQIAVSIGKRKLLLRPYFQDYEMISKNTGTITHTHFGRILRFLKIGVGSDEFRLLIKRFSKDAYTINYVAFVDAIDDIQNYLDKHGILHLDGKPLDQFPGRIITAELPKLPRPEIGNVSPNEVFRKQIVFHPVMEPKKEALIMREILQRVQRHILERRIRIHEFFKGFDVLKVGKITVSQFIRGLDALQISSMGRLHLAPKEIDALTSLYKDPYDPNRVFWKTFEDDVDQVFTVKGLEKYPNFKVISPPTEILELRSKGMSDWKCVDDNKKNLCQDTLEKIRSRVESRRLSLKEFFKNYDKNNGGHVSRSQLRQIFLIATLLLSQEEIFALESRYNDDIGFNYFKFLDELEAKAIVDPLYELLLLEKKRINAEKLPPTPTGDELNLSIILVKIKAKVVRERIKVTEFMKQFDKCREFIIKKSDFIRALDQLRCNLTYAEINTIATEFQDPLRPDFVEYVRFAEYVEEAVATGKLERMPRFTPLQHIPSECSKKTFLNFEERLSMSQAMDKLCAVREPNLVEIFQDFDKENIGTVTKDQFMKTLCVRRMLHLIDNKELDSIYKSFSVEKGGALEMDYRVFLKALNLLRDNKRTLPF